MKTNRDELEPIDPSTARELYLDHKKTHCTEATVRAHHYRTLARLRAATSDRERSQLATQLRTQLREQNETMTRLLERVPDCNETLSQLSEQLQERERAAADHDAATVRDMIRDQARDQRRIAERIQDRIHTEERRLLREQSRLQDRLKVLEQYRSQLGADSASSLEVRFLAHGDAPQVTADADQSALLTEMQAQLDDQTAGMALAGATIEAISALVDLSASTLEDHLDGTATLGDIYDEFALALGQAAGDETPAADEPDGDAGFTLVLVLLAIVVIVVGWLAWRMR